MKESRILDMTVADFSFSPNVLHVKKGENVLLRLKNLSGMHTFTSADLGIDITIGEGETKGFNIPTDKAGTFEFHSLSNANMKGQIIVE